MKERMIVILVSVMISLCALSQTYDTSLPEPAGKGTPGFLGSELIFPLEQPPAPSCHASTIAETPGGLVVAWFGGTREGHEDVGIWISRKTGTRWSPPVQVADGVKNNSLRYPCWNPVLYQIAGGSLILFYKVGPSPREWWGEKITSSDGGETWSAPVLLGNNRIGPLIGPVKNKPILLDDTLLICPSSRERIENGEVFWQVHFECSTDLGKTWEIVGPVNDGIEFDAIQPSLLTYPDGSIQALCRSRQQVVTECWSNDGGRTWSPMKSTSLPNPSAGTDGVTLADGRQLFVYNPSGSGPGEPGRRILAVATSIDGRSWKPVMTLENQPGEYSYPAVIQASDGLVHITYTYDRKSIKHVVIDPDKLH
jgi:predicted neuraminidase